MVSMKVVWFVASLVASASCQPVYQGLEGESVENRQAGMVIGNLLRPAIAAFLTAFTTNIAASITNAITTALAGARLELLPLENLLESTTSFQQPVSFVDLQRR